jgi:hypothetical protein
VTSLRGSLASWVRLAEHEGVVEGTRTVHRGRSARSVRHSPTVHPPFPLRGPFAAPGACCHRRCHSWHQAAGRLRTEPDGGPLFYLRLRNGQGHVGPPRTALLGLKIPWASAREGSTPSPGTGPA